MGAAAAIVSAVVVDGIAAAAIAAETITALEVVTAVGATLGAIGAVTGNKDLAMAGMVLGVVGGVGSLASNAGLLGDATGNSLFGAQAAESVSEPGFSGAAGEALGDSLSAAPADAALPGSVDVTAPADAPQQNFVDALGQTTPNQTLPTPDAAQSTTATTGDANSIINGPSPNVQVVGDSTAPPSTTPVDGGGGDSTSPLAQNPVTGQPNQTGAVTGQPATSGSVTGQPADPSLNFTGQSGGSVTGDNAFPGAKDFVSGNASNPPGVFSKMIDFAKNNQMVTYGIMQAGGSLLSGLTNPVTPAQINALNAQADANRAAANLSNTKNANIGQTLPHATRATTPSPNSTPPAGMINGG